MAAPPPTPVDQAQWAAMTDAFGSLKRRRPCDAMAAPLWRTVAGPPGVESAVPGSRHAKLANSRKGHTGVAPPFASTLGEALLLRSVLNGATFDACLSALSGWRIATSQPSLRPHLLADHASWTAWLNAVGFPRAARVPARPAANPMASGAPDIGDAGLPMVAAGWGAETAQMTAAGPEGTSGMPLGAQPQAVVAVRRETRKMTVPTSSTVLRDAVADWRRVSADNQLVGNDSVNSLRRRDELDRAAFGDQVDERILRRRLQGERMARDALMRRLGAAS